jgi:hypothetical protein
MQYDILENIDNLIAICNEGEGGILGKTGRIAYNSGSNIWTGVKNISQGILPLAKGLAVPALVAAPVASAYSAGKETGVADTLSAADDRTANILKNVANTFIAKNPIGTAAAAGLGAGVVGHHLLTRRKKEEQPKFTPSFQ